MAAVKSFRMNGDLVEVMQAGDVATGKPTILVQQTRLGAGPPPHRHTREDETFFVMAGTYEIFDGSVWHPLQAGEAHFAPRNHTHTFRCTSEAGGVLQVIVTPGGFENFLEQMSPLEMPRDAEHVERLSAAFGVFLLPPQPLQA